MSEPLLTPGSVIEVVAGPLPEEIGERYSIDADWLHAAVPGAQVRSPRHHLQRIVPPDPSPRSTELVKHAACDRGRGLHSSQRV